MVHNYTNFSEKELLHLIGHSDQKAFNALFEKYRGRLFAYLFKIIKSKETAEEIVLDVFLKIWVGRSILQEIDHFEAFIFRIARNKALDFLRMAQKSKLYQLELWQKMQELSSADAADTQSILADTTLAIRDAISMLSPQRRKVFQLSREHDLTYEQIAERLQISTHTVRNHIAASLQFIRAHLHTKEAWTLFLLIILDLLSS